LKKNKRGQPSKGLSREKTPPGIQNFQFLIENPPLSLVFCPFRARYVGIIGSRPVLSDPRQSAIRFKAIVLYAQGIKVRPLVHFDSRNSSLCHIVFNWMGYKSGGFWPTPQGLTV
jgi:hypothetical protein